MPDPHACHEIQERSFIFVVMILPTILFSILASSFPTVERPSSIIQLGWLAALFYRLVCIILPSGGMGIIME